MTTFLIAKKYFVDINIIFITHIVKKSTVAIDKLILLLCLFWV